MSNVETIHFRVGANFGITLMQIANEHLLYANDLDKALRVFTDSLGGEVPEELVLQLLSGEQIILVNEEEQMFDVVERAKYPHLDNIYPARIDFNKFLADKQKELDKHVESLDEGLDAVINRFRYKGDYRLDVPIKTMMKYIYGQNEDFIEEVLDQLEYDDDLQQMKSLIRITKDFIARSANLARMLKRLDGMYGIDGMFHTNELTNLAQKVQTIARAEFNVFVEGDDKMLESYMEASKEIDEVLTTGIEPVDIMENYSAGWLSPRGEYYALNGEIANMLHTQIASALQEQKLIPMHENNDTDRAEINPDAWLEQQGWVKIHDNNIQFGGCLNDKLGKTNIHMTDTQKKIIYNYIQVCHGGVVSAGWKMEKISAARFQMTDDLMLAKHYFSFD